MQDKFILDVTCGSRSIWFNKKHPNAVYCDIREESTGFIIDRPNFEIKPDVLMDFRNLGFPDKSFKMVVWDPPHLRNLDKKSWIYKKYGSLGPQWQEDLQKGFSECWRVLEDYGVLIFKWSHSWDNRPNRDISLKEVLALFPIEPLVGHTSGTKSNTFWISFMKIPEKRGALGTVEEKGFAVKRDVFGDGGKA